MKKYDVYSFLMYNVTNWEIKLGDKTVEVMKVMGQPVSKEEVDNDGYFYYANGLRIGYNKNIVYEIGIDFTHFRGKYTLKDLESNIYGRLGHKSKIIEVLNALNDASINYRFLNVSDFNDYIYIITQGNVCIILNVYENTLDKIAYTGLMEYDRVSTLNSISTKIHV